MFNTKKNLMKEIERLQKENKKLKYDNLYKDKQIQFLKTEISMAKLKDAISSLSYDVDRKCQLIELEKEVRNKLAK